MDACNLGCQRRARQCLGRGAQHGTAVLDQRRGVPVQEELPVRWQSTQNKGDTTPTAARKGDERDDPRVATARHTPCTRLHVRDWKLSLPLEKKPVWLGRELYVPALLGPPAEQAHQERQAGERQAEAGAAAIAGRTGVAGSACTQRDQEAKMVAVRAGTWVPLPQSGWPAALAAAAREPIAKES